MDARVELTAEQHRRRRLLSRAWAMIVLGWAFGRTLVVWAAVGDYGINPLWYLLIDLTCASIDAVTTPRTVLALVDSRYPTAALWGTASLAAFVVPDAYIFIATDHLPKSIVVGVLAVITVTLTFTIVGVVRKVRAVSSLPTAQKSLPSAQE
jgi:hypothetical protein